MGDPWHYRPPRRVAAAFLPGPRAATIAGAILLLFAFVAAISALNFPPLSGRVVDDANVMSAQARTDVTAKSKDLEDKSGIQLVVATVKSLQGGDIETFANGLFRFWKLGESKKNNGVLLLVAPNEHKVRIEVGYGLEGTLTDGLSSVIISSAIVPRFKANDYSGGIERGVDGIISVLTTDAAEWHRKVPVRTETPAADFDKLFPFVFFVLLVFVMLYLVRHAGPPGKGGRRGGGPIFLPTDSGGWGGGGGWSGGGGGFDGGGFSGGGGSSGGGGASGSW